MNQPNLIFTNMEPLPYTALKIKSDEVIHLSRRLLLWRRNHQKTKHLGRGGGADSNELIQDSIDIGNVTR